MTKEYVSRKLHSLSNLIMRYFDNSPIKKSLDQVTGTNGWIIGYLADHDDRVIYQKDLEKEFGITRSTASKVINRMEQKGLIRRECVAEDARLRKLTLTPEAWDIFHKMEVDQTNLERKLMKGFSEEETEKLRGYIDRMYENMMQ